MQKIFSFTMHLYTYSKQDSFHRRVKNLRKQIQHLTDRNRILVPV